MNDYYFNPLSFEAVGCTTAIDEQCNYSFMNLLGGLKEAGLVGLKQGLGMSWYSAFSVLLCMLELALYTLENILWSRMLTTVHCLC